jgi:hypothetical protein
MLQPGIGVEPPMASEASFLRDSTSRSVLTLVTLVGLNSWPQPYGVSLRSAPLPSASLRSGRFEPLRSLLCPAYRPIPCGSRSGCCLRTCRPLARGVAVRQWLAPAPSSSPCSGVHWQCNTGDELCVENIRSICTIFCVRFKCPPPRGATLAKEREAEYTCDTCKSDK